ncbi:MAG: DUF4091 domain-containing protein [Clostridiales bacterium]|nr:DUF4091 domain-containing protein [Clostridiales bacterium]
MFKKIAKRCVALLGVIVLSFGVVACQDTPKTTEVDYEVWTTYNTMKVVRDVELNGVNLNDNYVKMEKAINVAMAKAESEMGSLYVTTGEQEIDSFNLIAQDLESDAGDVFPVENMTVYAQRYIKVIWRSRNNTYEEYPLNCYSPDALVEMDLYRKAGEDKIASNNNQGFTVDFKTTASTPAGVYSGTFLLELNGEYIDIPVSVTVWDYAIPAKSTSASCVLIYEDSIMQGEQTSIQSEVDAWYRVYYETALEYRINPYMVPESTKSPEKFVENVVAYYDHPNFTSFGLPHQTFLPTYDAYSHDYADSAGYFDGADAANKKARYYCAMDYWFDCLYLLGKQAKENNVNYFEIAYLYPIDEPHSDAEIANAITWMEDLNKLKNDVADKLVEDGVFDANNPILDSIRDIDIVCTALGDEPALAGYDIVYVPEPYELEDYSIQTTIEKHAQNNDNPIWYYTQIDKIGDGPNLYIDDFNVAGRIQGWLEQYYNIDGWLYWEFNQYLKKIAKVSGSGVVNPYEDMNRDNGTATGCAGGGYFVYPASKYGASEPIKTLRLLTYRDGQEDKEALRYLESLYAQFETYYGVQAGTFDINNVFKGVYDKLFCRSAVYRDDEMFDACKEVLKDAIINAQTGQSKFVYNMEYTGKMATYTFYTAPGYSVKVNGSVLASTVSGQGLKHTYTMDASAQNALTSVELVKDSQITKVDLYEVATERAVDLTASTFNVTVTEGSSLAYNETGYDFTIVSKNEKFFTPKITFNGLPDTFKVIEIDLENNTNQTTVMSLRFIYSDGSSETKDIGLTANTARMVEVLSRNGKGKKITSVEIRFENRTSANGPLVGDRNVSIKGMRVR